MTSRSNVALLGIAKLGIGTDAHIDRMRVAVRAAEQRVPGIVVALVTQKAVANMAIDRIARFRLVSLDRHPFDEEDDALAVAVGLLQQRAEILDMNGEPVVEAGQVRVVSSKYGVREVDAAAVRRCPARSLRRIGAAPHCAQHRRGHEEGENSDDRRSHTHLVSAGFVDREGFYGKRHTSASTASIRGRSLGA